MKNSALLLAIILIAMSLASCGTVTGFGSSNPIEPDTFVTVVSSYPEYKNTGLPLPLIPLTQQSINQEQIRRTNEALSAVRPEPVPDSAYQVGARDILSVIVWDHPELNSPTGKKPSTEEGGNLVSSDGTIFYPYIGQVVVAGLSVDQIRSKLTELLSVKIVDPQLDVRVSAYRSKSVFVVGEVIEPGLLPITDNPMTLLDAINFAGGLTSDADLSQATLSRKDQTYKLDLNELFLRGDTSQNLRLFDGDILKIPNTTESKINVLGRVWKPAVKKMTNKRKTLAEAVEDAGGVYPPTTKPIHYFVLRNTKDGPLAFFLNNRTPGSLILLNNFEVLSRDIVLVETAGRSFWKQVYVKLLQYAKIYGTDPTT